MGQLDRKYNPEIRPDQINFNSPEGRYEEQPVQSPEDAPLYQLANKIREYGRKATLADTTVAQGDPVFNPLDEIQPGRQLEAAANNLHLTAPEDYAGTEDNPKLALGEAAWKKRGIPRQAVRQYPTTNPAPEINAGINARPGGYHATRAPFVSSILAEGIQPRRLPGTAEATTSFSRVPTIADKRGDVSFTLPQDITRNSQPIAEVGWQKTTGTHGKIFPAFDSESRIKTTIPPERLQEIFTNSLKDVDLDAYRSGRTIRVYPTQQDMLKLPAEKGLEALAAEPNIATTRLGKEPNLQRLRQYTNNIQESRVFTPEETARLAEYNAGRLPYKSNEKLIDKYNYWITQRKRDVPNPSFPFANNNTGFAGEPLPVKGLNVTYENKPWYLDSNQPKNSLQDLAKQYSQPSVLTHSADKVADWVSPYVHTDIPAQFIKSASVTLMPDVGYTHQNLNMPKLGSQIETYWKALPAEQQAKYKSAPTKSLTKEVKPSGPDLSELEQFSNANPPTNKSAPAQSSTVDEIMDLLFPPAPNPKAEQAMAALEKNFSKPVSAAKEHEEFKTFKATHPELSPDQLLTAWKHLSKFIGEWE